MGKGTFTEYAADKHATDVYIKGGSANPLAFKGTVTTATDSTHFSSTNLTGHGDDAFKDWYVYVFRDVGGVAPQGEHQPISGYVSATGAFTHTAFTADLALNDEVLIVHESQMELEDIIHEQADTPVNITAILASETDVLDLNVASTRYIVRNLRLKAVDPGVETITVRLRELINNVSTIVDTFTITTANFGTYHSLMDMFGLPHLAGDDIQVTVQASAAGPYTVTGQYSHAKTNA